MMLHQAPQASFVTRIYLLTHAIHIFVTVIQLQFMTH